MLAVCCENRWPFPSGQTRLQTEIKGLMLQSIPVRLLGGARGCRLRHRLCPSLLGGGTGCCFSPLPLLSVVSSVTPPTDHGKVVIPLLRWQGKAPFAGGRSQARLQPVEGIPCARVSHLSRLSAPLETMLRPCRTQGPRLP